jgi:hypothetical protein
VLVPVTGAFAFLGAKSTSIRPLRRSVHWLVSWLVRPHDAITWKTCYVAIASRRGGGRGKLVTSLFLFPQPAYRLPGDWPPAGRDWCFF